MEQNRTARALDDDDGFAYKPPIASNRWKNLQKESHD
jgi:hypothetical protein